MLPVHLPRVDVVIDVESKICPCCGGALHKIGETVKEMLDVVPVQYLNLDLLIRLAKQHQLPGMFYDRIFVTSGGGLMSYGSIAADRFRGAASYVDRILRGAKVSELPVQFPTKFELGSLTARNMVQMSQVL
jgi:hypothetical protein